MLRHHLGDIHLDSWVPACDRLGVTIANTKEAQQFVTEYQKRHGQRNINEPEQTDERRRFSQGAFVDAIMEFIVIDDQVSKSINLGGSVSSIVF